jgi:hypothetical protein
MRSPTDCLPPPSFPQTVLETPPNLLLELIGYLKLGSFSAYSYYLSATFGELAWVLSPQPVEACGCVCEQVVGRWPTPCSWVVVGWPTPSWVGPRLTGAVMEAWIARLRDADIKQIIASPDLGHRRVWDAMGSHGAGSITVRSSGDVVLGDKAFTQWIADVAVDCSPSDQVWMGSAACACAGSPCAHPCAWFVGVTAAVDHVRPAASVTQVLADAAKLSACVLRPRPRILLAAYGSSRQPHLASTAARMKDVLAGTVEEVVALLALLTAHVPLPAA